MNKNLAAQRTFDNNFNLDYKQFLINSVNPIFVLNRDRKIVFFNKSAGRHFYKIERNKNYTDLIYSPEQIKKIEKKLDGLFSNNKKVTNFELKFKNQKGYKSFISNIQPIFNNNNQLTAILFENIEQNEKLNFQKQPNKIRTELKKIIDSYPVGVVISRLNGNIEKANPTYLQLLGIKDEKEIIGKSLHEFIIPEEQQRAIKTFRINKLIPNKKPFESEFTFQRQSGDLFHTHITSTFLTGSDKKSTKLMSVVLNFDKFKQNQNKLNRLVENRTKKLRESEEMFRALTENSFDVVMRFDRRFRHLYVNPHIKETLEITPEEMIGKTHKELGFPKKLVDIFESAIEKVFKTGKTNRVEFQLPNGIWIDWLLMPEFDNDKNVKFVITSARDITQRKKDIGKIKKLNRELETRIKLRTKKLESTNEKLKKEIIKRSKIEKKLSESEKLFRTVIATSIDAFLLVDPLGKITYANQAALKMYGFKSIKKIVKRNILDFFSTEDIERTRRKFDQFIKLRKSHFGEYVLIKDNKKTFNVELSASVIFDSQNNPKIILVILRDITKRKIAEKLISEREQNYRTLFDLSPSGILVEDAHGKIIDVNSKMTDILGYSKKEFLKMNVRDITFPGNKNRINKNLKALAKGEHLKHIVKNIRKDGSLCYLELFESKITLANGVEVFFIITNDITERIKTQREIIDNEFRYRMLFKNSPSGILLLNSEGIILKANPSLCNMLNYSDKELTGKQFNIIIKNSDKKTIDNNIRRVLNGEHIKHKIEGVKKDGSEIDLEVKKMGVPLPGGLEGIIVIINDISEQLKHEKELLKAKKEAEKSDQLKSEFLAQMSHEIRSPINVILSFTSLLKEEFADKMNDFLEDSFASIDIGGRRIIRTIDMILNMSELQTGTFETIPKIVDLNKEILENIFIEYKQQAKSKRLNFEFASLTQKSKIKIDIYSVTQLISNLVDNAIKYTKQGKIKIKLYLNNKSRLCVDISDTGIGIAKEYIPYLFDAFSQEDRGYTRKFEGNGLGLALVKKYCELNNAGITVKSKKGFGTTFTINFNQTPE